MALSRSKYKRITSLYVRGTELVLADDTVMWLQVLNPFERDEAQRDANLARSRILMTLKGPHAQDERDRVAASFYEVGRDETVESLSHSLANNKLVNLVNDVRDDPDWKEKVALLDSIGELAEPTEAEHAQLNDLNQEYLTELYRRSDLEYAYQAKRLATLPDAEIIRESTDNYIENRSSLIASAEYNLTEIYFAARVCEGVQNAEGIWNHDACEKHATRVFETKDELRQEPGELQELLSNAMRELNMSPRDARFLDKPESSSPSSPPPSEEAASTPSTPTATPSKRPGTSPRLSSTH